MFQIKRALREEQGITALETAIILIAFVVVASVFAFTILSAGTFSTEKGKEAIYAGLAEVRGSMTVRGSVVATSSDDTNLDEVQFTLANVAGGAPVDMSKVTIDYRDTAQLASDITFTYDIQPDGGNLLEVGNMARVTVPLSYTITANTKFALEIKPPSGPVILLERTAPATISAVMDLY